MDNDKMTKTLVACLGRSLAIRASEFRSVLKNDRHPHHEFTHGPRIYFILRRPIPTISNLTKARSRWSGLLSLIGIETLLQAISFQYTLAGKKVPCSIPADVLANYLLKNNGLESSVDDSRLDQTFVVESDSHHGKIQKSYPSSLGLQIGLNHDKTAIALVLYGANQVLRGDYNPTTFGVSLGLHENLYGEVLYVGKTTDSQQRFRAHEKMQEALENRGRDEDIFILTCTFRQRGMVSGEAIPRLISLSQFSEENITDADKLTIIERVLIHYFDPPLNKRDNSPDSLSSKSETINRSIVREGYSEIYIPFDPENPNHFIGSKRAGYSPEHHIRFEAKIMQT